MVTFSVPVSRKAADCAADGANRFRFSVYQRAVVLAGSRNREIPADVCGSLLKAFSRHGFSFFVGCASGVDHCFLKAIAASPYKEHSLVACAFEPRVEFSYSRGLLATKVVPDNVPSKAALHRRTVWMVKRCSMLCLFPEDPATGRWGKGSALAFKTAMFHVKPVFVVAEKPPKKSIHYVVLPARLFATVNGYWAVPHPYGDGGTCDEEW